MDEDPLRKNFESVQSRVAEAARRSGREPSSVTLVAVTKKSTPEVVRSLVALGAADLGENYPQSLWAKVEAVGGVPVRWHLIGHLQTNKASKTLSLVRMVHAVDSLKLLKTLDDMAASLTDPPSICLQVNTSGEWSKHGWSAEAIVREAEAIAACQKVPIVGLMTIAPYGTTDETARPSFVRLREVRDILRSRTGLALDDLSMGMSGDFEAAIEEGATFVRVGSALFEGLVP
ncbi:MAG: YggS family pyridoxal phosphate-dependent enzyme [Isosphaeraceae bacterium]